MPTFSAPRWPTPAWILRYGAAVLSVSAALVAAQSLAPGLGVDPASLYLLAVMLSAWFGGAGPALLATLLSLLADSYYAVPAIQVLGEGAKAIPRLLVFVVSALLAISLSIASRGGAEPLLHAMQQHSHTRAVATPFAFPIAAGAFAIGIFIIDSITEPEIDVPVLYIGIVLMAVNFLGPRGVVPRGAVFQFTLPANGKEGSPSNPQSLS